MPPSNLSSLPPGYIQCQWCSGGVRFTTDPHGNRIYPQRCPHCAMNPHPSKVDETVGGKVDPQAAKKAARNRSSAPRIKALDLTPQGRPVLGIDPGYRYTGIALRDGDAVLYAETLVRPKGEDDPVAWARTVSATAQLLLFQRCPAGTKVGIEGVTASKGFKHGKQAAINPGPIIFTAVVLGAVAGAFPEAVIVPPGGNGSQHITNYPPALVGQRPIDLPGTSNGAGTRGHEQSAYDVAGKAAAIVYATSVPVLDGLGQRTCTPPARTA